MNPTATRKLAKTGMGASRPNYMKVIAGMVAETEMARPARNKRYLNRDHSLVKVSGQATFKLTNLNTDTREYHHKIFNHSARYRI